MIRQVAKDEGVPLVDVWTPLKGPDGNYVPANTVDQVHPSAAGASIVVQTVLDALHGLIGTPSR